MAASAQAIPVHLDPAAGEFGFGPVWLAVGLTGAAALYGLGWRFEDTRYFLADVAVALWAGILPLWLLGVATGWRARWGAWVVGLAVGLVTALVHLAVCWIVRGRINDDLVGISALFGAAPLAGWTLGRGLHTLIRRSRARVGIAG